MNGDTTIIPIVVAILGVAGAILAHAVQQLLQYKATQRQNLIESYSALLVGMAELRSTLEVKNFICELQKAWLFASDDVLELCQEYIDTIAAAVFIDRHLAEEEAENPDLKKVKLDLQKKASKLDGLIALAMRKHALGRTRFDQNWIEQEYHPFAWLPPSKEFLEEIKKDAKHVIHAPSPDKQ